MAAKPAMIFYDVLVMLSMVIITTSLTMLVCFGEWYVQDYQNTKNFIFTQCTVSSAIISYDKSCQCDAKPDCISTFPCLEVTVSYRYQEEAGGQLKVKDNAYLFSDFDTYHERGRAPTCAVYSCVHWEDRNKVVARDYRNLYGTPGQTYSCAYNPKDLKNVIRLKTSFVKMVVSMCTSASIVLVGLVILTFSLFRKMPIETETWYKEVCTTKKKVNFDEYFEETIA